MAIYITSDGDIIALVAAKYYGSTANRVVEQVLEANPGVAEYGARLPAGLRITMPAVTAPAKARGVKLWA